MSRIIAGILGLLLVLAVIIPSGALAHEEDCAYCVQCPYPYTERMKIDEENPSNHYVLFGDEFRFNCLPGDEGYCGELIECPEEDTEAAPVDEPELVALVRSKDLDGLREFIDSNRNQLGLILERDLILVKDRTACTDRIVRIYEVRRLRTALLE